MVREASNEQQTSGAKRVVYCINIHYSLMFIVILRLWHVSFIGGVSHSGNMTSKRFPWYIRAKNGYRRPHFSYYQWKVDVTLAFPVM